MIYQLKNTGEFINYKGLHLLITTDDDGKIWLRCASTETVDSVSVFADGNGNKWKYYIGKQVINAFTPDSESVAYTGIDNTQTGLVFASNANMNLLRVAFENLRLMAENMRTQLKASGLLSDGT